MLNIYSIVSPSINNVQMDEEVIVYRCRGQRNIKGEVKSFYDAGKKVKARFHPEKELGLQYNKGLTFNQKFYKIYLLANKQSGGKISSLDPTAKNSGDLIKRTDKSWWLCVEILENYFNSGWISVRITPQNFPGNHIPEMEKSCAG